MANALTDESRDARLKVNVDGLMSTLRSPEAIRHLVMYMKPAGVSVGDFALISMLNECLMAMMVRRDYRAIYSLMGTLFGPDVPSGTLCVECAASGRGGSAHDQGAPIGTSRKPRGTDGTPTERKPPAKAGARAGGIRDTRTERPTAQ